MIGLRRVVTASAALPLLLVLSVVASAAAQTPVRKEVRVTPWGKVLDYTPNGGWRAKARQVSGNRQRMLSRGAIAQLNAPMAGAVQGAAAAAISGTERVPVILFRFSDHGTAPVAGFDTAQYNSVLFGDIPPNGRPYTVKSFYKELSNNLFTVQGAAYGWFTLPATEATYTGPAGGCPGNVANPTSKNCNGLWSQSAFTSMQSGLVAALQQADATVDFSQYDNDGPDGIPNSGDDDGVVDLVIFVQSEEDGACDENTNNHPWSHKSSLSYTTNDARAGGGFISVQSYTMQSGVGGSTACNTTQIMPTGTATHETGHTFGLPDLYDVSGPTEGIGEWGLMGSGNYTSPLSPTRMEAWSLSQLGWVTVRVLSTSGTYALGAAPTSDTTLLIRPTGANPRGEYFLVENREAVQSDSAVIRIHCQVSGQSFPTNCGGGLAIWHFDSTKYAQALSNNTVNSGSPQALLLMQADGLGQLQAANLGNRGDAGDLWPGTTNNTVLSANTNPASVKNSDGSYAGFGIDSIQTLVPNGAMSFRLIFGGLAIVRADALSAKISVDGVKYNRFAQLLTTGSTHTIAMDSAQSADGLTQYLFNTWSDGGARSHTFVAQQAGDSISASVLTKYFVQATASGGGTITPAAAATVFAAGQFVPKDTVITLIAVPPQFGVVDTWAGDTVASGDTLTITVGRPYNVSVSFLDPTLTADAVTQQITGVATPLSTSDKRYLDLLGNKNGKFDLGDFLAWVNTTAATPAARRAAMLARLKRMVTPAVNTRKVDR